jgi:poly-beta-1,6-N-acetyl-D-glucosamine N-deacetylase
MLAWLKGVFQFRRNMPVYQLRSNLRRCLCTLLARALIAVGRVRRMRNLALSGNVITAIYFHRPSRALFAQCVGWLTEQGYTFISADDLVSILYDGGPIPKGAVWLSFDDGCKEILEDVLPLIRQRRIPITLFIPSGIAEGDGLFPWLHGHPYAGTRPPHAPSQPTPVPKGFRDAMTMAQVREVAALPEVTIGAHTVHHIITATSTEEELRFEIREAKRQLEASTASPVNCFAYPEGRFSGRERHVLMECGYAIAVTTENAFIRSETDPYLVPRFSVADDICVAEAICNMVGVWRPAVDPLKGLWARGRTRWPGGRPVCEGVLAQGSGARTAENLGNGRNGELSGFCSERTKTHL